MGSTKEQLATREDCLRAYNECNSHVEYSDALVGWTIAILYSVQTAPLKLLRIRKDSK